VRVKYIAFFFFYFRFRPNGVNVCEPILARDIPNHDAVRRRRFRENHPTHPQSSVPGGPLRSAVPAQSQINLPTTLERIVNIKLDVSYNFQRYIIIKRVAENRETVIRLTLFIIKINIIRVRYGEIII